MTALQRVEALSDQPQNSPTECAEAWRSLARSLARELDTLRSHAEAMATAIEHERDNYPAWWKYSKKLQAALASFRQSNPVTV